MPYDVSVDLPLHALLLGVLCALAYAASAWLPVRASADSAPRHSLAHVALLLAWLLHALMLAVGLGLHLGPLNDILGAVPHFGFAPALSVTVWLVVAVYAVESHYYPQLQMQRVLPAPLAVLSLLVVLLALFYPGQAIAHHGFWLPLHFALGIASYGLFAVAVVHALLMLRAEERMRRAPATSGKALPLLTLERLTFRFVAAGFVLLTATLIAGLLFDELLYGSSVWQNHKALLNHKTIFSFLSWIVFAVLLYGRHRLGWRGWRAARWLFTGAGLLLLAYVGSRFVLEIILSRGAVNA